MITYNWTIVNLYTETIEGQQDYVVTATFEVEGVEGEFSSTVNGSQAFSIEGDDFIPYSDLTQEIVVDWIMEALGPDGLLPITSYIDAQIESQINPPVVPVNTPLPWAPVPVEA